MAKAKATPPKKTPGKSPFAKKTAPAAPGKSPLFTQIENIWTKENKVTTDTKPESIYMINRFLSLSPSGFMASLVLNETRGVPEWAKLPYLYHSIDKQAPPRNKYPKAEKLDLTPKRKKALERICAKFCVKPFHGLQIIALLEQQGIQVESD